MAGGIDRYYQVARCFRDEDSRADRQPEFTQLDLEASFVTQDDIQNIIHATLSSAVPAALARYASPGPPRPIHFPSQFPTLSYADAMKEYGSDKPDLRSRVALLSSPASAPSLVGLALPGAGSALSRKQRQHLLQPDGDTEIGKPFYGLVVPPPSKPAAAAAKPLVIHGVETSIPQLASELGASPGDFLVVGPVSHTSSLGKIRVHALETVAPPPPGEPTDFVWISDFPMFEEDPETGALSATHHPFTAPHEDDLELLRSGIDAYTSSGSTSDLLAVRSQAYDLVLHGAELGGGSIRIHQAPLQRQIMSDVLGIPDPDALFGHLLTALSQGTPPHGGIALGVDRLLASLLSVSIRDTIAFPKAAGGRDLLTGAPS